MRLGIAEGGGQGGVGRAAMAAANVFVAARLRAFQLQFGRGTDPETILGKHLPEVALSFEDAVDVRWLRRSGGGHRLLATPRVAACRQPDGSFLAREALLAVAETVGIRPVVVPGPAAGRAVRARQAKAAAAALVDLETHRRAVLEVTRRCNKWRKRARRETAKNKKLQERVRELEEELSGKQLKPGRFLTAQAGLRTALLRAAANMSAKKTGVALQTDMHHSTVTRWEVLLAASILAAGRAERADLEDHQVDVLRQPSDDVKRVITCTVHAVCCDATNTAVWQKTKLHNLQVRSFYFCENLASDIPLGELANHVEVVTSMADLRPVVDSSVAGIHALMAAQVSSLGIKSWQDAQQQPQQEQGPQEREQQQHLTVWAICTDAGGDAAAARRQVVLQSATQPCCLVFDLDCLMHQFHLVVKSSLMHLQTTAREILGLNWKYCSTLAMLLHLWRDNARRVHKCWQERYPEDANCCMRMPPKFIGGRWGSISGCENYLLQCPSRDHAAEVLLEAVGAQKTGRV